MDMIVSYVRGSQHWFLRRHGGVGENQCTDCLVLRHLVKGDHSPGTVPWPAVPLARLPAEHQRDRGRVGAPCSLRCDRLTRADGTLRRPPSLPGTPHTLAPESLIGINSNLSCFIQPTKGVAQFRGVCRWSKLAPKYRLALL